MSLSKFISRRASLDIGSGSIKCMIADVEKTRISRRILNDSKQLLCMNDLKKHGHITDSNKILGQSILQHFKNEINSHNVSKINVVATEVFRKSPNGSEVITSFEQVLGHPIQVISPEEEAALGFRSGLVVSGVSNPENLVVWDCGAGSSQLKSLHQFHHDSQGSGTVYNEALKYNQQINPFGLQNLQSLISELHTKFKKAPEWILNRTQNQYVSIGTAQSIFNQQKVLSGLSYFSKDDVMTVLKQIVDLGPEDMHRFEQNMAKRYDAEYAATQMNALYILPKLTLLYSMIEHLQIRNLQFYQTNGNCEGLLIDESDLKTLNNASNTDTQPPQSESGSISGGAKGTPKSSNSMAASSKVISPNQTGSDSDDSSNESHLKYVTVNWHLQKNCNYKCTFCYAHFENAEVGLDLESGKTLLKLLKDQGIYKINFAGGEPFLNQHLGEFIKYSKEIGLKTSVITNASRLTGSWLRAYGPYLDLVGISCDSVDEEIQKQLGRGYGQHVQITSRAFERIKQVNQELGLKIKIKLNTVITSLNHHEDWSEFLLKHGIQRWKIFKVLKIEGENDSNYDSLAVDQKDFENFVARHKHLEQYGVSVVPEDNDQMTTSYLMITPDGKFYQNTQGKYNYSDKILDIGVEEALRQTNFDYEKFQQRGGAYVL